MRTVELSDEIYERAEREAAVRGLRVGELVDELLGRELPTEVPEGIPGRRVKFPIFESEAPGALRDTKELLERLELEDDLRRGGFVD